MIRFDSTIPIKFKGVEKKPETREEKQQQSLALFEILVKGQMDSFSEKCGVKNLGINLGDYEKLLGATYHKELFGDDRGKFDEVIRNIDEKNRQETPTMTLEQRANEAKNAGSRVREMLGIKDNKGEEQSVKEKGNVTRKTSARVDMSGFEKSMG